MHIGSKMLWSLQWGLLLRQPAYGISAANERGQIDSPYLAGIGTRSDPFNDFRSALNSSGVIPSAGQAG
jgi:hypothetical protein